MFEFPLDTAELFEERARQFRGWGIPKRTVSAVRAKVREPWSNASGGWSFEWEQAAAQAESRQQWLLASLCHGAAKFPSPCNGPRQAAMARQVECYLKASDRFPCHFERRMVPVDYLGETLQVPVHLFTRTGRIPNRTVILSGGVDTHKMELHRLALALTWLGGFRVAAMDMPGTGEFSVAISDQSHLIYESIIAQLRSETGPASKVGILGISFGGYWAARLALTRKVDCAVNIGGPLVTRDHFLEQPFGMNDTIANALRLDEMPADAMVEQILQDWNTDKGLLAANSQSAPLFCANGEQDQYIPVANTLAFRHLRNARIKVIPNATHCAPEKLWQWVPQSIRFLRQHLRTH